MSDSTPLTPHHPFPFACRVLPHRVADGPTQMALDEALLDSVAAGSSGLAVRTYEWAVPTLSLGYFQHWRDVIGDARWRGVPVVRRPTGGGALWHDREWTYAVVVPRSHPLAHPSSTLYRAIHEAIAGELRRLGWSAARREASESTVLPSSPDPERPFLCFRDREAQDVVVGAAKVVGSAQRRRAGAVLQHGSILLSRSPTTPELPGLEDLSRAAPQPAAWNQLRLQSLLVATLGESSFTQDWTDAEQLRADELQAQQYGQRAWTERR